MSDRSRPASTRARVRALRPAPRAVELRAGTGSMDRAILGEEQGVMGNLHLRRSGGWPTNTPAAAFLIIGRTR